jgi:hypothetical protein
LLGKKLKKGTVMTLRLRKIAPILIMLAVAIFPAGGHSAGLFNQAPMISEVNVSKAVVDPLEKVNIDCVALDRDRDPLVYHWSADGGTIKGNGPAATWTAPAKPGAYTVTVKVTDPKNAEAISKVIIDVLSKGSNNAPIIESLKADSKTIFMGKDTTLTCVARDPDGDKQLTYTWQARDGVIKGEGSRVTWTAPPSEESFKISCVVTDSHGKKSRPAEVIVKVECDCKYTSPPGEE